MGFKESLLKKIEVDRLADHVIRSINQPDSSGRFDKTNMKKLLSLGNFNSRRERDLDLYILSSDNDTEVTDEADRKTILVLDNGLGIYKTSVADVCLRKSPTVKEMISIRNAIKILNDKDVLVSKKGDSVRTVQADIISRLDLAYSPEDIDQIEKEGRASLENNYSEGILEALALFAELLGYQDAPKPFKVPHYRVMAAFQSDPTGKSMIGPVVLYDRIHNTLKLIESTFNPSDKEKLDWFNQIVSGHIAADKEGTAVFNALKDRVPSYQR